MAAGTAVGVPPTIIDADRAGRLRLGEVWDYRELLWFFVWRQVKVRYKQTVIGLAWAIIQPVATMVVFALFFGRLAGLPADGLPYPVFYLAGLVPWTYFAQAVTNSTNVLVENQRLVTKIYFPRLLLPASSVVAGLVDFGFSFVVLIGVLLYYGFLPTLAILWLPVFLALAVATAGAIGLWTSGLNALYRDVRYVVPFLVQFGLFLSPIAYSSQLVPQEWRWLYFLNPMAGVVDGFRWSLTGAAQPPLLLVGISALAVLGLLAGGLVFFQRMQTAVADAV